jgi:hypothetical protein
MLNYSKLTRSLVRRLVLTLTVSVAALSLGLSMPAMANGLGNSSQYITADGRDLTATVECLPKELSEPNLDRALQESKNDFLEKVFDVKADYDDYKLDETEMAYLTCMEAQGVTPQVKQ